MRPTPCEHVEHFDPDAGLHVTMSPTAFSSHKSLQSSPPPGQRGLRSMQLHEIMYPPLNMSSGETNSPGAS